jgi:ribosomal protein L44E
MSAQKPQTVPKKIGMYCTNCHTKNHNIETCRIKRKEDLVPIVFEVTTR